MSCSVPGSRVVGSACSGDREVAMSCKKGSSRDRSDSKTGRTIVRRVVSSIRAGEVDVEGREKRIFSRVEVSRLAGGYRSARLGRVLTNCFSILFCGFRLLPNAEAGNNPLASLGVLSRHTRVKDGLFAQLTTVMKRLVDIVFSQVTCKGSWSTKFTTTPTIFAECTHGYPHVTSVSANFSENGPVGWWSQGSRS